MFKELEKFGGRKDGNEWRCFSAPSLWVLSAVLSWWRYGGGGRKVSCLIRRGSLPAILLKILQVGRESEV